MSVPTTLQGTHDGCGGTVVFRPATHRRELLAGRSVTLRAACRSCGATLSIEWALPGARAAAEQAEQTLPMAAGAEEWQYAQPAASQQHAPAAPAPAPTRPAAPQHTEHGAARPVTSLGEWRMRTTPAANASAQEPREAMPAEFAASHDPAVDPYLSAFSSRVESARENLRRMSTELPSALAEGDAFRAPKLRRADGTLPPSRLSAASALRPSAAPAPEASPPLASPTFEPAAVVAAAPVVAEPVLAEPVVAEPAPAPQVPAPEPVAVEQPQEAHAPASAPEYEAPAVVAEPPTTQEYEPAVEAAIASAVASPSFHDDHVVAAEEPTMPATGFAPAPAELAPPAPQPVAPPAPAQLEPTDADVYPPADVAAAPPAPAPLAAAPAPLAPAMPEPELLAAAPAPPAPEPAGFHEPVTSPDAAANVWAELPVAAPDVPVAAAAAPPAPPAPPAPQQPAAPVEPATPSFADAFGDAAAAMPAEPGAPIAAAPAHAPEHSPVAGGAAVDTPDASVAFEADRGFDWGGADEEAAPPKPRRSFGLRRKAAAEPDPELVAAGPEVVFEPSADPEQPKPRTTVGLVGLVLIVILAVIAGLAATKIVASRNVEPIEPVAPAAEVVVPPAETPAATPAKAKATTAKAQPKAKAGTARPAGTSKAAAPKQPAGAEQIPAITTTPTTPGNVVSDTGTGSSLADAATAATTQPSAAQVTASAADTAGTADDNPFAP